MIRLAMLGAGNHAQLHAESLRLIALESPGRVELAAVCDLDEAKARDFAQRFGFQNAYTQIDEMLGGEQLDGLLAITPLPLTAAIAADLIPRGIPLLIEKPPGETSDEAARLLALAQAHHARHMVSFNRRFSPALLKALEWINAEPERRRPFFCVARMLRHHRLEPDFITGTGIHLIDAVNALMGQPTHVSAVRMDPPRVQCPHYLARVSFGDRAWADVAVSPDAGAVEETYELHGPECCVRIDALAGTLSIHHRKEEILSWSPSPDAPAVERDGTLGEMRTFIAYLEDPARTVPMLADGLAALRVAEAIGKGAQQAVD